MTQQNKTILASRLRLKNLICLVYLSLVGQLMWSVSNSDSPAKVSTKEFVDETRVVNDNRIPLHTLDSGTTTTEKRNNDLKTILIWNNHNAIPFHLIHFQKDYFAKNKCRHTNCILTNDKNYLPDQKDFDVIVFSGCYLRYMNRSKLPKERSSKQRYVFATLEPSTLYPVTNPIYDNFFNWTWTHRLNSDILWRYLSVFDLSGKVIGPAMNVTWPKEMKPIGDYVKSKLKTKTKAAAWFVSHCRTIGHREDYIDDFNVEFKKYGWKVDTYGGCGNVSCEKYSEPCYRLVEKDYYFYMAFENSIEVDYVSEKLLTALNNFAVPVVYGGADYSRFLPPGSYLDARKLKPSILAKIMDEAIRNKTIYYDFFRWRNHFRYESSDGSTDICNICTALNNPDMMNKTSTYKNFRAWWNGSLRQKTYEFMLKNFLINNALLNFASTYNFTRQSSFALLQFVRNQSVVPNKLYVTSVYTDSKLDLEHIDRLLNKTLMGPINV